MPASSASIWPPSTTAVRDKDKDDPTLGLLHCGSKNQLVAEYALRDIRKPIGVADIQLTRQLPDSLQSALPTVKALEAKLADPRAPENDENGTLEPPKG